MLCQCCFGCGRQHRDLTVLLIGLDNAGKTSVLYALKRDTSEVTPTFGFSSATVPAAGCKLHIYDLGGSKGIRRIWTVYTAEAHGVIYVVDAADPSRLQESHGALQQLVQTQQLTGKPVLVLANKQDMPEAISSEAVSQALDVPQLQQERPCAVYTCTAKQDTQQQHAQLDPGIQQGLQWLVSAIDPIYPQLQAKVDKESAEARALEQQRKQDREDRARQSRLERLHHEKEAEEQQKKQEEFQQQQQQGNQGQHPEGQMLIMAGYEAADDSSNTSAAQQEGLDAHPFGSSTEAPPAEAQQGGPIPAATPAGHHPGWQVTADGVEPAAASSEYAPDSTVAALTPCQAVTSTETGHRESPDVVASVLYQATPARPPSAGQQQGQAAVAVPLISLVHAVLPGAAGSPEFSDLQQAARDECGPTPRRASINSQTSSTAETPGQ